MTKAPSGKIPRWKKVIDLHNAGAIDLKQVPVRGYSETIRTAYSKAHKGESVVHSDWVKAYKRLVGRELRAKRKNTPLTLETAIKLKKHIEEMGGRKVVDKWIDSVKELESMAGGDLRSALRQLDEVSK